MEPWAWVGGWVWGAPNKPVRFEAVKRVVDGMAKAGSPAVADGPRRRASSYTGGACAGVPVVAQLWGGGVRRGHKVFFRDSLLPVGVPL